jgi:hypothetical protein
MLRQQGSAPAFGDPSVGVRGAIEETDGRLIRIGSRWLIDFRSPGPRETTGAMTRRVLESLAPVDVATVDVAGHPVVEVPLSHPGELDALGSYLFENGIYAATDGGGIRLRICAAHTWEQVEQLVRTLHEISDRFRPRPAR